MPADALRLPARRARSLPADRILLFLFAVLSLQYACSAILIAARAPLWMDEVLALWTARQGSPAAIWSALRRGGEFCPPLYDLLQAALRRLGVTSALGLRLPSIIAMYGAALAIGEIARRRFGYGAAAIAAGIMLSSGVFAFAVQARPYAMVTAVFAGALLVYDRTDRSQPSWARTTALAALLAIAIGLHFYALLLAGMLALIECGGAMAQRRAPCWRTLGATAVAAASLSLWSSILLAAADYSAADVAAPAYYARPTWDALRGSYTALFGWPLASILALIAAATATARARPHGVALDVMGTALAVVPVIVFAFALLVSHSYADRYVLASAAGVALLGAGQIARLGDRAIPAACGVLLLLIIADIERDPGEIGKADRLDALALAAAAPGALPLATGSGLRFFEIAENTAPAVAHRLVYLDLPDAPSTDPTNRHQVERWKAIRPDLRILPAARFLCDTPAFLLLTQPKGGGPDELPAWLAGRARFTPPPSDRASLTLVRPYSCNGR